MDLDKLADRDRARRLRQLKQARLQAIALIICLVAGLAYALVTYFGTPKKKKSAAEAPAPVVVSEPASKEPAAPEPPAKVVPKPPLAVETVRQTPPGMVRLSGDAPKPAVPVANVLASFGVTDSEKSRRALPKVEEARRVLDLLAKSSHLSGKLEYVINKPGIELRMKDYYETQGLKDPEVGEQMADFELQMAGDRYLDVVYKNATRPSGSLHVSFVRDEKNMVRLDWESFVGFSAMGMRTFRDKRPAEAMTMRVLASIDDYYNYEFSDSKKYLSVRLRNADGSEAVNGYCEHGGRVAMAINARLATAQAADAAAAKGGPIAASRRAWAPILVKLRFPTKAQSDHCVELLDLMHGQWLAPGGLAE